MHQFLNASREAFHTLLSSRLFAAPSAIEVSSVHVLLFDHAGLRWVLLRVLRLYIVRMSLDSQVHQPSFTSMAVPRLFRLEFQKMLSKHVKTLNIFKILRDARRTWIHHSKDLRCSSMFRIQSSGTKRMPPMPPDI